MKEEWNDSKITGLTFSSLNNEIDASVKFNIESLNNFSFREDEGEDAETKKNSPDNKNPNYSHISDCPTKIEEDEKILNEITEIVEFYLPPIKKKICGLFTKEDFDVKASKKLNDSFKERYHNPLEDDDYDIPQYKKEEPKPIQEIKPKEEDIVNTNKKEEDHSMPLPQSELSPIQNESIKDNNEPKKIDTLNSKEPLSEIPKEEINIPKIEDPSKIIKQNRISPQPDSSRNHSVPILNNNDIPLINSNSNSGSFKNPDSLISSTTKSNKETKEEVVQTIKKEDSIDSLKKINELTEKLEKSENKFKIVNDTNSKLLEVINIFKVLQTIDRNQKKKQNHQNNNQIRSPSLNETFEKGKNDTNKRKSRSLSKKKNLSSERGKLYIDYIQTKHKTYTQIYGGAGKENRSSNYQTYKSLHCKKLPQPQQLKKHSYSLNASKSNIIIPQNENYAQQRYNNTNSYFNHQAMMNQDPNANINISPVNANGNVDYYSNQMMDNIQYDNSQNMMPMNNNNVDINSLILMNQAEPYANYHNYNNYGYDMRGISSPCEHIMSNDINPNSQNNYQTLKSTRANRHKLLDYNAFQVIFDETEKGGSESPKEEKKDIPIKEIIKNKNINVNNNNNNMSPIKNDSDFMDSAYNSNNSNVHITNKGSDKYMIPFYLLSQKEMYDNIMNYMSEKPKKLNVTYTRKIRKAKENKDQSKQDI